MIIDLKVIIYIILTLLLFASLSYAQVDSPEILYDWPILAAPGLTSNFGHYRSGRFHAGIDIKTWDGKSYPCIALTDGWVWRIYVNASGYGRALYVKQNDGNLAVYGHLSGFSSKIQRIVEAEQKRVGHYRLDLFFRPGEIPLKRNEVIGYTGTTGLSDGPHLHFELRDKNHYRINPLRCGIDIEDHLPPLLEAITFFPYDFHSKVNGTHFPITLKAKEEGISYYTMEGIAPLVEGNFTIGCKGLDITPQTSGYELALYRIELYVDGILKYYMQMDYYSYDLRHQANLLYHPFLYKRNYGKYYRLYNPIGFKLPFNILPEETGVLNSENYTKGLHNVRIRAWDCKGNQSILEGSFLIDDVPQISKFYANRIGEQIDFLLQITDEDSISNIQIAYSEDNGEHWYIVPVDYELNVFGQWEAHWKIPNALQKSNLLFTAQVYDSYDVASPLYTHPYSIMNSSIYSSQDTIPPEIDCEFTYYSTYIDLDIHTNETLLNHPIITIQEDNNSEHIIMPIKRAFKNYWASISILNKDINILKISINMIDLAGNSNTKEYKFDCAFISRMGNSFNSKDNIMTINFPRDAVYEPFVLYHNIISIPIKLKNYELPILSQIYTLFPNDIALNKNFQLTLTYNANTINPEELGIFRLDKRKRNWKYAYSKLNTSQNSLTTNTNNMGFYAILRDTIPPEVKIIYPTKEQTISNRKPLIQLKVSDKGLGIYQDNIILYLDGHKVISEWHPLFYHLKYRVRNPLNYGKHTLKIWVKDRAGHITSENWNFYVRK